VGGGKESRGQQERCVSRLPPRGTLWAAKPTSRRWDFLSALRPAANKAAAWQGATMATSGLPEANSGDSCLEVKSSNTHAATVKNAGLTHLLGANFGHLGKVC